MTTPLIQSKKLPAPSINSKGPPGSPAMIVVRYQNKHNIALRKLHSMIVIAIAIYCSNLRGRRGSTCYISLLRTATLYCQTPNRYDCSACRPVRHASLVRRCWFSAQDARHRRSLNLLPLLSCPFFYPLEKIQDLPSRKKTLQFTRTKQKRGVSRTHAD